jgi:hypothetical protein
MGMGDTHVLIVELEDSDDPESLMTDIEHPVECPRKFVRSYHRGLREPCDDSVEYECWLQYEIDNAGLFEGLAYSGTPVTAPGRYLIAAWHEEIRGFEWTEHDGGITVLEEEDDVTL